MARPVTDPEWAGQEGDNDGDLEPSGPNHSAIRVVSEELCGGRPRGCRVPPRPRTWKPGGWETAGLLGERRSRLSQVLCDPCRKLSS